MATKTYSTLIKDGKVYAEVPLRDVVERSDVSDMPILSEIKRLYEENDRLRELVRVMAYCMQCERECDGCRLNGADGTITAPVGCDGLLDRLRDLEIEVDA